MTKNEIIKAMAVAISKNYDENYTGEWKEQFMNDAHAAYAVAEAAIRERCAAVAYKMGSEFCAFNVQHQHGYERAGKEIAAAIRNMKDTL